MRIYALHDTRLPAGLRLAPVRRVRKSPAQEVLHKLYIEIFMVQSQGVFSILDGNERNGKFGARRRRTNRKPATSAEIWERTSQRGNKYGISFDASMAWTYFWSVGMCLTLSDYESASDHNISQWESRNEEYRRPTMLEKARDDAMVVLTRRRVGWQWH